MRVTICVVGVGPYGPRRPGAPPLLRGVVPPPPVSLPFHASSGVLSLLPQERQHQRGRGSAGRPVVNCFLSCALAVSSRCAYLRRVFASLDFEKTKQKMTEVYIIHSRVRGIGSTDSGGSDQVRDRKVAY